ncbi:hypothetical protein SP41_42 [Salmonella phage 41]|nr:hypothetical protein SP41_42 [Salmonella phage 41]
MSLTNRPNKARVMQRLMQIIDMNTQKSQPHGNFTTARDANMK